MKNSGCRLRVGNIKAVIFDLDGTLVRLKLDIKNMKSEIIQKLVRLGIPREILSEKDTIVAMYRKAKAYLEEQKKTELSSKVYDVIVDTAEKYERRAAEVTTLVEGVDTVLERLRTIGLKLGLITNNGRTVTNYVLEKFDIKKYFDAIVTRDDGRTLKPDPSGLILLLSKLEVSPDEALLIGDSIIDILAAKNAGILPIGVEGGFSTRDELLRTGAVKVLRRLMDILTILEH
ncbi:MAG: HAD family hydrolase [Candidatus Baldrarchaeia archaeon]